MPRHICPDDQALTTLPLSTSQSIRKWPSMRVMGSMVIRVTAVSNRHHQVLWTPGNTGNVLINSKYSMISRQTTPTVIINSGAEGK